jgi:hypothetical protein
MGLMTPAAIRILRYVIPAAVGTVAGVALEHWVWKGRGA